MDRTALADFLRRRREALQPGDVGLSLSQPRFGRSGALDRVGGKIPSQVIAGDRLLAAGTIISTGNDHDLDTAVVSRPGRTEAPDVCGL
jgi:hypothetical protein